MENKTKKNVQKAKIRLSVKKSRIILVFFPIKKKSSNKVNIIMPLSL